MTGCYTHTDKHKLTDTQAERRRTCGRMDRQTNKTTDRMTKADTRTDRRKDKTRLWCFFERPDPHSNVIIKNIFVFLLMLTYVTLKTICSILFCACVYIERFTYFLLLTLPFFTNMRIFFWEFRIKATATGLAAFLTLTPLI